jgi:hypothetical protein
MADGGYLRTSWFTGASGEGRCLTYACFTKAGLMAATRVPDQELQRFLEAGHNQADAARHFGVSGAAIHQRLKRMRGLTSQVVALERAGALVDQKISAGDRFGGRAARDRW